jgi:hypothetical protein
VRRLVLRDCRNARFQFPQYLIRTLPGEPHHLIRSRAAFGFAVFNPLVGQLSMLSKTPRRLRCRVLATTLRIEPILGRVAHAQTASVRLCIARLVNVFLACAQFRTRILSSGPHRPYALTLDPGKASWAQAPPEAGPEVPSGLPCCYSSPWYSWFARDSVLEWAV